jgi:septum site-determining protein MinC
MKQPVVIKGCMSNNINGITVILDEKMPFTELLHAVADKFEESADFLKDAKFAIGFEGRELNPSEERALLDTITDHSNISILFLMDNDRERQNQYREVLQADVTKEERVQDSTEEVITKVDRVVPEPDVQEHMKMFYKGTLRSGQEVCSDTSLVIMGDVNPGAKAVARDNVIILGTLKGTACAGVNGNKNAFVVALNMNPMQIHIADVIARCSDHETDLEQNDSMPMIAYLEENNIYIDPLNKEILNDLQV